MLVVLILLRKQKTEIQKGRISRNQVNLLYQGFSVLILLTLGLHQSTMGHGPVHPTVFSRTPHLHPLASAAPSLRQW